MIDDTLGRYRITGKLGEGGMGVVYRAHDDQLRRDLAIKLLSAKLLDDPNAKVRLLREARAAASLNHPNICTVYDVGEADGQIYIAMELIEGSHLGEKLESGPLPYDTVIRLGHEVADALAHAHERGIVHRDLKSLNVMVGADGRCKILDFGLAARLNNDLSEATTRSLLTEAGDLVGTPAYMAPEQFQGQTADERSDVWALGVMLYELVSGARPFTGKTAFEVTSAILSKPPAALPAKVPIALRVVIERCLEKNPQDRYAHAGEVKKEFEALLQGNASSAKAWYRRVRRRPMAISVLATVLALSIAIGFNFDWLRARLSGNTDLIIDSVAVLPFDNYSGDPKQDDLANGITDALTTDLWEFEGLKRVIPHGVTRAYKGTKKSHREVAQELEVAGLITGSVSGSENRVSVSVQLINPVGGLQLWGQRYERARGDVLDLQNDIVTNITQQLRLRMTPEERARLARTRKVDPEAYEYYVKGMIAWNKHTPEKVIEAEDYFRRALTRDPGYAAAYRGIGYVEAYKMTTGSPPLEVIAKLRELDGEMKKRGLHEDSTQAEYYEQAADMAFYFDWEWAAAEANFKKALQIKPNSTDLRLFYWHFLAAMNDLPEARKVIERGLELEPFSAFAHGSHGLYLLTARRWDEAIKKFQWIVDNKMDYDIAHLGMWSAYHHKGMTVEALAEAKVGLSENAELLEAMEQGFREAGYKGAMKRTGDLLAKPSMSYILPTNIAKFYAYAGEKEKALDQLEAAREDRDSGLVLIQVDPDWDTLRQEPRFKQLMAKMGFPK